MAEKTEPRWTVPESSPHSSSAIVFRPGNVPECQVGIFLQAQTFSGAIIQSFDQGASKVTLEAIRPVREQVNATLAMFQFETFTDDAQGALHVVNNASSDVATDTSRACPIHKGCLAISSNQPDGASASVDA